MLDIQKSDISFDLPVYARAKARAFFISKICSILDGTMKKFLLYLVRWQLSSPILAICLAWMGGWNIVLATIVANLIGGCIFFWVDRWIFREKKPAEETCPIKK